MPILIGVSPRAWMMNGEATWNAPRAAAPLISVRRLNFGLKVEVMAFSGVALLLFLLGLDCRWLELQEIGLQDNWIVQGNARRLAAPGIV